MDIIKSLKIGLTSLLLATSSTYSFAERVEDSRPSFQDINIKNSNAVRYTFLSMTNTMLKDYVNHKNNPLSIEFMDASNPSVLKFYNSVTRRDNQDHLAMTYFKNFNVDGVNTPTCFIFYEPSKNIFEGYLSKDFTQEESFTYLVSHELGHCLFKYANIDPDPHGKEVLADLFSIATMMNEGRNNLAVKVIKNSKTQNDKIHETGEYLEKFFLQANEKNIFKEKIKPQEVIDSAYSFYKNNY